MQNLDEVRGEIKAIVEACQGTPTAKLIAVLDALGITETKDLAALLGVTPRAVQLAKQAKSTSRSTVRSEAHFAKHSSPAKHTSPESEAHFAKANPASPRARVIDNTSLTSLEDRSQNLVKPPIVPPAVLKTKRGTRLPEDWALPEDWREWSRATCLAASPDMIDREALKFGNYWQSKAGRDAIKIDWKKTWQNWCLTAFATAPTRPQSNAPNWVDERREKNRKFLEMVRNLPASGVAQ